MSIRKILFWFHLAVGCAAGVVILIMSVTGVLLAYERRIIGWLDRDLRPASISGTHLGVEEIAAKAAAEYQAPPSAITLRSASGAPAEISFGRDRVILADPYTGAILGESAPRARAFLQRVEGWHRWLAVGPENRATGRAVTGACNFAFVLLAVSGPFLWMPRKWSWQSVKAITLFRGGLAGRARDFNWHNVIGIWCTIPLFVIAFSGVVMSYPWANDLLYRLTGSEPPAAGAGPRGNPAGGGPRGNPGRQQAGAPSLAGINALWTRAEQQVPGWKSVTLRMTGSARGPLAFTIDTGDGGRPDQRSQLTLDRRTGEVVRWEPFSSYNSGRRLRSWLRFLHTGEAGGLAGQTIACAASAGGAVLVWTGISLAWRRLVRRKKRVAQTAVAA